MTRTYTKDNLSLREMGIDPIKNWSDADCREFWDTLIKENLRLMRDTRAQLEDILNWVFSEYFEMACRFAGLEVEAMRSGILHVVDIEKLKPAKKKLSAKSLDAIWASVEVGESLSLFELVESTEPLSSQPKLRASRRNFGRAEQLSIF